MSDVELGTMTVHPHGDESLRAQELGASIFVGANRNMMKAAEVSIKQMIPDTFRL